MGTAIDDASDVEDDQSQSRAPPPPPWTVAGFWTVATSFAGSSWEAVVASLRTRTSFRSVCRTTFASGKSRGPLAKPSIMMPLARIAGLSLLVAMATHAKSLS